MDNLVLPTSSLYILHRLQKSGFEAFLVGGAVRDNLGITLGLLPSHHLPAEMDYDYTTNAKPEEIMQVFPESFYQNEFGTVSVTRENIAQELTKFNLSPEKTNLAAHSHSTPTAIAISEASRVHESLCLPQVAVPEQAESNYEITTYRVGEKYEHDCRHPSCMAWGKKLTDDLSRRDFTINALALGVDSKYLEQIFSQKKVAREYCINKAYYQLIDKYQGWQDLQQNLIRCIGESNQRFREDGLRLMRAVRLSVQLNFAIEEQTYLAIGENASLLEQISFERIRDELFKILSSDYPREGIMLLEETGLLAYIIPELLDCRDVAQSGHHLTDVWVHSLSALAACPSSDPLVRLATLLHDIGKPATQKMINGKYTFYNHEIVGANIVYQIAQRLRLSRLQTKRLVCLVRHHMFSYDRHHSDAAIRRFMRKVGLENLNDILAVREGDRLGSNAAKTSWRLEEMKKRMIEQLHQPLQVRDLAVDGNDLIKELQLSPGPVLGQILGKLLEMVLEDSSLNTKEKLLTLSRHILSGKK